MMMTFGFPKTKNNIHFHYMYFEVFLDVGQLEAPIHVLTVFENHLKSLAFEFFNFGIFHQFGIFNELSSTQNANIARFARNIETFL